ncbi:hypothetical protein M0P48_01765 [Candidatus Gracilibacteria bacterium]|jgi:hypothetical protein|nr:hypothetical protein [Candidatus Gracilibacteria bacterium]
MTRIEKTPEIPYSGIITNVQPVLDRHGEYYLSIGLPHWGEVSMPLTIADLDKFGIHSIPKAGLEIEWTGNPAHPEYVRIVDGLCDGCIGKNTLNPKPGALENRCNLQQALSSGDGPTTLELVEGTKRDCLPTARATGLGKYIQRQIDSAVRASQQGTRTEDLDS